MIFTKKRLLLITIILLVVVKNSLAQFYSSYLDYDWTKNRTLFPLTPEQKKEDAIILKDLTVLEYSVHEDMSGKLRLFYTKHKIVKINSEHSIQKFNKVYIPLGSTLEVIDLKVRTISPSGKTTELNKNNIKEINDLEDAGSYKIFAVEGVEIGCEIEYIVKLKKSPASVGREIMQSEYPAEAVDLVMIIPDFIHLNAKSYNGFHVLKKVPDKLNIYHAGSMSVPKKREEPYSNYKNSLMRVEYKIEHRYTPKEDRVSWPNLGSTMFYAVHETMPTGINKEMKNINIPEGATEEEKIRAIEKYIKTTYALKSTGSIDDEKLSFIIKNKYGSAKGITKLFMAMLDAEKISYHFVLSNNKNSVLLDPDFPSWNYLDGFLLYFKKFNSFIDPTDFAYRYPMIPSKYRNTQGLFMSPSEDYDGASKVTCQLGYIPPLECEKNFEIMNVKAKINIEAEQVELNIKESLGGEKGINYQPYYALLDDDKKIKMVESVLKKSSKDGTLTSYKVDNCDKNSCPEELPIIFTGSLTSSSLLQKAGDKYLFRLGDIIGPQNELYADTLKRELEIQVRSANYFKRTIEFEIPEGYKAKNLESISKNVSFDYNNEKRSCYFKSDYKIDGNKIIVTVDEYYKQVSYPAAYYEDFKNVINAAADFNKVVILLEK